MRDGAGLLLLLDTMATSLHWRLWPLEKSRGLQGPPPTITGPKQMKTLRAPSVVGCWRHRSCQFLVPTQKKHANAGTGIFLFSSTLAAGMCPAPPPPFRRRRLKRERQGRADKSHGNCWAKSKRGNGRKEGWRSFFFWESKKRRRRARSCTSIDSVVVAVFLAFSLSAVSWFGPGHVGASKDQSIDYSSDAPPKKTAAPTPFPPLHRIDKENVYKMRCRPTEIRFSQVEDPADPSQSRSQQKSISAQRAPCSGRSWQPRWKHKSPSPPLSNKKKRKGNGEMNWWKWAAHLLSPWPSPTKSPVDQLNGASKGSGVVWK